MLSFNFSINSNSVSFTPTEIEAKSPLFCIFYKRYATCFIKTMHNIKSFSANHSAKDSFITVCILAGTTGNLKVLGPNCTVVSHSDLLLTIHLFGIN